MVSSALFVGIVILTVAGVTVYDVVQIVEEGEVVALLVFGEMRDVLRPGLNIVPPFVSATYSIDPETMTMDTGTDRVGVHEEFEDEVRRVNGR